jgi:phosphoserine phosphatase
MQDLLVAFDVDGTLRDNTVTNSVVPNERVCRQLIDLAHTKNVEIMVWSGGGELYARQCVKELGLASYVDHYADKQVISCTQAGCPNKDASHWHFGYDGKQPDIAFDDIQSFALGKLNIIVREK